MMLQGYIVFYASAIFITLCCQVTCLQAQSPTNGLIQRSTIRSNMSMISTSTHAWSSWGSWSSCSKSCGGGVAVQERQCLPRNPDRWRRSRKRRKLSSTERQNRRRRDVRYSNNQECAGLSRRYHECNTAPCPGVAKDPRSEQCAVYDRRPFRGRFYTWVPYVDGDAPCTLNCRPRGQHFYASLALVDDGTPCTKPGFRAICVQGSCKAKKLLARQVYEAKESRVHLMQNISIGLRNCSKSPEAVFALLTIAN